MSGKTKVPASKVDNSRPLQSQKDAITVTKQGAKRLTAPAAPNPSVRQELYRENSQERTTTDLAGAEKQEGVQHDSGRAPDLPWSAEPQHMKSTIGAASQQLNSNQIESGSIHEQMINW